MWHKNIAGRFFGLVTKQACDGQTDRQTDRQNYDSQDRARIAASRGNKSNFTEIFLIFSFFADDVIFYENKTDVFVRRQYIVMGGFPNPLDTLHLFLVGFSVYACN